MRLVRLFISNFAPSPAYFAKLLRNCGTSGVLKWVAEWFRGAERCQKSRKIGQTSEVEFWGRTVADLEASLPCSAPFDQICHLRTAPPPITNENFAAPAPGGGLFRDISRAARARHISHKKLRNSQKPQVMSREGRFNHLHTMIDASRVVRLDPPAPGGILELTAVRSACGGTLAAAIEQHRRTPSETTRFLTGACGGESLPQVMQAFPQ